MSDQRDSAETGPGHLNIVLTPEEKKVFGQLFQAADNEDLGVVTGELAVKFFKKSGLSPRTLGEIWGIADTENRGLLTKVGFSVALRLIGQAQNGQHPRPELAQQPGPLPRFEGVNIVYPSPPVTASPPPPPPVLPPQSTGPGGMIRVPPPMPQDVDKFSALFEKSGAVDGLLQGNLARDIFQRSRLPTQTLIQIWNLADRQGRGALGCMEFVVAMHLITCCKNGSLPALPQILPPGWYDAAAGRPPTRSGPDRRALGRGMAPPPPIPKQFSGPQAQRAQSPLSRNNFTPPVPQNANAIQRDLTGGGAWAVSADDKQRFDAVFLTVDKTGRGFINGEEAVPFFSNSNLPEDVLAQIWDLADINKAGQLNRDEFAIAMYLIVQQRSNPGIPLPEALPLNLIPPSVRQRRQLTNTSVVSPSPFDPNPQAPPPPQKSAADDLFGLDSFTSGAQAQVGPAPSAGPFEGDMFGSKDPSPSVSTVHSPIPPQSSGFLGRPAPAFVPQSSFGQSIIPSSTGGSNHSGRGYAAQQQQRHHDMDDLLGDADPEVSKKLTNESTELANLSNQIGSLTKQTQELNIKRVSAESNLLSLTTQKQNIEAQLAQLRTAYEKEAAQVKRVEEQLAVSRQDTAKATQEYHKVDAEYNQLQYRRQELTAQLEADKAENESLKEKMNLINAENRLLREELERLQMQARRERGLVAINKKQVEKSEQEREKLKSGVEEASRAAAASPPPPGSPTLSQGSIGASTNPFYARKSPPIPENTTFAPSPFGPVKQSMDDVFGPGPFSSTPPQPQSFGSRTAIDSSSYTPSGTDSAHGGRSTPTTSAPPSSYHGSPQPSEAPPPAVGSQMTSAFLPLPLSRADSVTSSVQVNPSASVRDADFSRPDTPTNMFGSASLETPGRERREDRSGSFSVKSDAGNEASGRPAFSPFDRRNDSPFGQVERNNTGTTSGGDENRPRLEKSDSFSSFIPGAFPPVESSPIKAMPTGESTRSRVSAGRPSFGPSDPFSMGSKDPSKDFEDAFSKFGPVAVDHTGGSASISAKYLHDEFPPIQEVRPDSDSDSEIGFEDNFTTASPVQTHPKLTPTSPTNASQKQIFDPATMESASTPPPPASAQQPPPQYGADKPYEFGGLLHDAPTPGGGTNTVVFPSVPTTTTTVKDEFDDDAFRDLTDAIQADDKSADNDFGSSSAFDDAFNPVFGDPKNTAPGTMNDGDDFKFTFNIDNEQPRGDSSAIQAKPASPEDWDVIFATFGDQPAQPQPGKENLPAGANGTSDQSGTDPGEGGVSLSSSDPTPTSGAAATSECGIKVGSEDDKVEKLTGMGFDRESSVKALEKNGWNIDQAVSSLLSEA